MKINNEDKEETKTEPNFSQTFLDKISRLTQTQQEFLANFLHAPQKHVGSTREDVVVLSDLLHNIRKTLSYKNRKQHNSTESQTYAKYLTQEKEVELELYGHLQYFGVQLRKGGYDSRFCKNEELNLTDHEKSILDSVFPETGDHWAVGSRIVPLPEMSLNELEIRDKESSARHIAMFSDGKTLVEPSVELTKVKVKRIRKAKKSKPKKIKKRA